jgi:hypothetical protein
MTPETTLGRQVGCNKTAIQKGHGVTMVLIASVFN